MADVTGEMPIEGWEKGVLAWLTEAIEEGEAFLKSQPGYDLISRSIDTIMNKKTDVRPAALSTTRLNQFGKCAEDLAAMMTDVKPFWEYRTNNPRYSQMQVNLGKLATHWWLSRHMDMRLMDTIKYALPGATSYAHLVWNPDLLGGGDIDWLSEDPRDVIPIRPNGNTSIQDAVGVMIRRSRTVNYLKARYPSKAYLIKADHDSSQVTLSLTNTRAGRILETLGGSPYLDRLWGRKPAAEMPRIPSAAVYTVYVHDDSVNQSSNTIIMGRANWEYEVKPGDPKYPRGRCIEATRTAVLYDGPNKYWHGLFPCPKLTLSPWPWTFLGKAPLADLLSLQNSLDKSLRIVDDHLEKYARPDVIADKNSVSKAALSKMDTRRAGQKYLQNPIAGKGMQLIYPNPLDPAIQWFVPLLREAMNDLAGIAALQSVMQLAQVPSAETVDKIIATMSPAVRARSRVLESFVAEIATIMAFNFAQFYTLPMRLMVLGPGGITKEDFDFDPGSMIPDFVHADDFDKKRPGYPTFEALARGPRPRFERAQELMKAFTFHIAPGSLLSASEVEDQLKYLQLARAGLIDHFTLLEKLNVPNIGIPPDLPQDITGRLLWEQMHGLQMAISPTGRKASGQTMPRGVVKESK